MNNLEWIEKEIEGCKIQIEREKTLFLKEKREGILRHLNQIKYILEAWEVTKDKITIIGYYDTVKDYEEDINEHKALCLVSNLKFQNSNDEDEWFIPLTEKETYKIEKALEVKNE